MRRGCSVRHAMPRSLWIFPPALLAVFLAGCGSDMASVSGTVTYDGKPLDTGTVGFFPVGPGPAGYGSIQPDGSFRIRTGQQAGLPPGEYRITVQATGPIPEPTPENLEPVPESIIPERYGNPDQSGLTFTVEPGSNQVPIALKTQ